MRIGSQTASQAEIRIRSVELADYCRTAATTKAATASEKKTAPTIQRRVLFWGDDRRLESSLLFGNLEQRLLELAQRAELLLDVPELRQSLLDLLGSTHEIDMTAFELGLHGDQRLEHRFDNAFFDRVGRLGS